MIFDIPDDCPLPLIQGYILTEQLHTGNRTGVYRAMAVGKHRWMETKFSVPIASAQGYPVVIKVLRSPQPSIMELVQFRSQYEIAHQLNHPAIAQPIALEPYNSGYALVFPDENLISLAHYWRQTEQQNLSEVLAIALQLADALHYLSQQRVIHKDIKPTNILIHPETKQIKLTDFGIASLLPREQTQLVNPNVLEGTLAYMAPEQTGRMNRGIDYRTDFYGLGVTLYELLTGQLPFQLDSPMELIHCHIAKMPVPPYKCVRAEGATAAKTWVIPKPLSDIILKLMAKNAEDRYQSALGLTHDLQHCLNQWHETGTIGKFKLGAEDRCDRFLIPEKLYGREAEVQTLLEAFDRVSKGASELMLVAGFSGIGKTAVVNEVHKPITGQDGYFTKGKFDQFNRNIPLSAFVQAFRNLVGQLLSESDADLQIWKAQLLEALGENAQVIIDLIPELATILGPQPSVSELSGTAAQNRFNLLFQKFIQVFTTPDHPLVIFIDDLQWADSASLNLIQVLMAKSQTRYLLLLGTYRNNEVSPAHPLMLALDDLRRAGSSIHAITLQPLSTLSLNHLIADTLHAQTQVVHPLTELVMQKTQGNPFFATQFLNVLHQEQLITFDYNVGHWLCDIGQVRGAALTDDAVTLMVWQLQKLPQATQEILKLAACLGAQFDLKTLAIVSEKSQIENAIALWKALQAGFILPTNQIYKFFQDAEIFDARNTVNSNYHFLHDRVQQAAYSLIADDQKSATHWHIGNLLWQSCLDYQEDRIFDLVNQLNLGKSVISQPIRKKQLAQLNLQAAQKAKLSAAYKAAQTYCEIGISLLPTETWQTDYRLMYALHYYGSESAYLSGNFKQAEELYEMALQYAETSLDRAAIYRIQMTQYQLQGRNAEAIVIQQKSTQLLGWTIPTEPQQIQTSLNTEIATVTQFLEQQTVASILEHPKMTDALTEEMLRILQILFYTAWLSGQPTLALLALAKMTTLSLHHGNSEMSPFGYVGYGLIANTVLKNITQSYQFGSMAVQLCEQFDNPDVRGMTNFFFAADVHSWKRPLREADQYYENAYKYGMDAGNWLTVSFMMMVSGSDRLTYGKNLEELYQTTQTHVAFFQQIKSLENLDILMAGVLQPVRQLLGLTASVSSFDDDHFSEADYLQKYQANPFALAWFYSVKIRHAYLFEQVNGYSDLIPKVDIIESAIPAHAKLPSTVFYVLLMHLKLIEKVSDDVQQALHWQAIQPLEDKLNQWQQDCPENIKHKCLLIRAEKARLQGHIAAAIDFYEQSIAQAQAQGYEYEAALAHELAAKFYLNWGKKKVAAGYMQEAYYCYTRWGAKAKVIDLKTRYLALLKPILQPSVASVDVLDTLSAVETPTGSIYGSSAHHSIANGAKLNQTFDLASVLQASQVLASTIQLDDLLRKLTQIILQNSGADRCALILPDQAGKWQVRVLATLETIDFSIDPLDKTTNVPVQLIRYVKNLQEIVFIDENNPDLPIHDPYLIQQRPKSILCLPVLNQSKLLGIVYLSNQINSGVFNRERITVLNFLCTQAAVSLENARLYQYEQRRVEILAASEKRLATLFNKSKDAIFLLGDQGFIDCNQAAVALFRYTSKNELLLRYPYEISPERQPDGQLSSSKAQFLIQEAFQRCSLKFEWVHQRADGEDFWAEITLILIEHQDEIIFHCIARDISDRKQVEAKQQRQLAILESTSDFIGSADPSGNILYLNQAWRTLLQRDECQRVVISQQHPAWALEIIVNEALPAAIQDGMWVGETALLDGYEREIPVSQVVIAHKSSNGDVEYFSTIARDISDRKIAQQQLDNLIAGTATTGQDFFSALVSNVAKALTVSCALVTQQLNDQLQTLALWFNNEFQPSFVYKFAQTPCEIMIRDGEFYCPANVQQRFPEDVLLVEFAIDSYLGIALKNGDGKTIGGLSILNQGPIPNPERAKQILSIFAARAAAELERQQVNIALEQLNQSLEAQVVERTAELRENEERLRLAMRATKQGFFDVDLHTDKAIVSPEYALMLGYEPTNFHETIADWQSRLHPEDSERTHQAYRDYIAGQTPRYIAEFRQQTKQGGWKWTLSMGQFIEWDNDGEPTRFLGIHADIDDRKLLEIQLENQNELLAKIAQGEPLIDVIHRLVEIAEEGLSDALCVTSLLDKNQTFYFGIAPGLPAEFNQTSASTVATEDLSPCARAAIRNEVVIVDNIADSCFSEEYKASTAQFGFQACWSTPIRNRDNQVLGTFALYYRDVRSPKNYELKIIEQMAHIAGIAIERQQADEQLRHSEANLLEAQRVAHVGNWELDVVTQTITWSPEMFHIHGLKPSKTAPSYTDYLEMLQADERQYLQTLNERAITSGIPYMLEHSMVRPDGTVSHYECRAEVEQNSQGQVIRLFGTALDITERKQAELALQNLIQGTAATTGQDFFAALVRHIAEALQVTYAIVTEKIGDTLHTLAFWGQDTLLPRYSYPIADTPCEQVFQAGEFYCDINVQQLFPHDQDLVDLDVESYLGIVLCNAQGDAIGHLFVMNPQAIATPQRAQQILRVFAARAAAELERQRAQTALEELNRSLEAKVTERTAELQASQAYYQSIVADQTELICRFLPDGTLTFVNDAYCQYFQSSSEELIGTNFLDLLSPADRETVQQIFNTLSSEEPVITYEHQMIAPNNVLRWQQWTDRGFFDVHGNAMEFQAVGRDITAIKEAEIVIQRHLRTIEASIDGISILRDDCYVFMNQSKLDLFGYTDADELLGQSWKVLYYPEEIERFEQDILPKVRQHGFWRGKTTAKRLDGTVFPVEISLTLTSGGDMIRVCRDISERQQHEIERKQAEEQIRQSMEQLEASNHELESFAYSISHDLRAPLRAINGFSQALLEDYGELFNQEGQDYFDRIRANANRMGDLIDDLLRLSRVSRSELHYTTVDLSAIAQEVLHDLQTSEPDRQVEIFIASGSTIFADTALMQVVLMNLLQNAWKFTSHHPTARIEFGVMSIEAQESSETVYFVKDNGAGFDMAYRDKLFGVFQRLHNFNEFPGTGIGLASVQRAVHRHGGRVWADAAVEQGATFFFTIPAAIFPVLG